MTWRIGRVLVKGFDASVQVINFEPAFRFALYRDQRIAKLEDQPETSVSLSALLPIR